LKQVFFFGAVFKRLVQFCRRVKMFSHEGMSCSVDFQQEKSIFISLEGGLSIFKKPTSLAEVM